MARSNNDQDDSVSGVMKSLAKPYLELALLIAAPYVIVGAFVTWVMAGLYPKAVAVMLVVLVIFLVAILFGFYYLRRKLLHYLISRRADRQDAAYLKGKDKGIYGRYRPENLD